MQLTQEAANMAKRATVTFEDEQYAILEKWADKEVRSVANLIQAIVVGVLRGSPPEVPDLEEEQTDRKGKKG